MNGPLDKKTQMRADRAMIQSRVPLSEVRALCDVLSGEAVVEARCAGTGASPILCPQCASVRVDVTKNAFHCHDCGAIGDPVTYVMIRRSVDTQDAISIILNLQKDAP